MRKVFWISIIILSTLIPLAGAIIIPIILGNFIWLPLIIVAGVEGGGGIIIGIIFLIIKLKRKTIIPEEVDIKEAKKRAINESLMDGDDPDNFIIFEPLIYKIGAKGVNEKTPILVLIGWGSETNKKRVALINLKASDKEISWLKGDNASDENIEKWAIRMAETQPDEEKLKITTGRDQFGLPIITREETRQSPSEIKKEKEKEEAESKNIV